MTTKDEGSMTLAVNAPDGTPAPNTAQTPKEGKGVRVRGLRSVPPGPTAQTPAPGPAAPPPPAPSSAPATTPAPAPANAPEGSKAPEKTQETAPATGAEAAKAASNDDYKPDQLLLQILQTKRRYGTSGDAQFRMWLFNLLKRKNLEPVVYSPGNIYVSTDKKSTVLFSSHTDTVHGQPESTDPAPQRMAFDPVFGHLFLSDESKKVSGCLGGDDGCGIYVMLKMLDAGVKGHYMFHCGEEQGGVGANAFVKSNKDFLKDIEMVVAFDRAVYDGQAPEIIHTQGGKRCASDEFSLALATALSEGADFDEKYVLSGKGSFTDSKVYSDLVPECVNIGCFYNKQHTSNEYVDVYGLEKLVQAAIKVQWQNLPIKRVAPGEMPVYRGQYYGGGYGHFGEPDDEMDAAWAARFGQMSQGQGQNRTPAPPPSPHNAGAPAQPQQRKLPLRASIDDLEELGGVDDWIAYMEHDPDRAALVFMRLYGKYLANKAELEVMLNYCDVE